MFPDFAVIIPMANEEKDFHPFFEQLKNSLDKIGKGKVYFIVDNASKDNTLNICRQASLADSRFATVFEPANKNVVDAYLRGYKEAVENGHGIIIEMDAGLSHDPASLPLFLEKFNEGYECVFGSRFIKGGSMNESDFKRRFLSKGGTWLANVLLGSKLRDMTSGYQGFTKPIAKKIVERGLLSKAHFYQTEVRYLLRNKKQIEIPIQYRAPSPSVSQNAITNSLSVLFFYFFKRIGFNAQVID